MCSKILATLGQSFSIKTVKEVNAQMSQIIEEIDKFYNTIMPKANASKHCHQNVSK